MTKISAKVRVDYSVADSETPVGEWEILNQKESYFIKEYLDIKSEKNIITVF